MPSRTIPFLSFAAAALVAGYLALVAVTVYLAAWQTSLAMQAHEVESDIARLEARYYDLVAEIDQTDPGALGLVAPVRITYAETQDAPAVTLR